MQSSENLLWIFRFSVEFEKQHPIAPLEYQQSAYRASSDVVLHDSV